MIDENEVRKIALEFFKDKFQSLYNKQKELINLIQSNAISDLNHYEVNKNRISELEKKRATNKIEMSMIAKLEKRIAELEASSASHTEEINNAKNGIVNNAENINAWADGQRIGAKEIAELRDLITVNDNVCIPQILNQLTELKDAGSAAHTETQKLPCGNDETDLRNAHDSKPPEPKSKHNWSHLTEVSYCDLCGKFAHDVGYKSECIIDEPYIKDRRCPNQKSLDTTGCNYIDYKQQECKTCPYYPEKRLPDATGIEPRENEPNWIDDPKKKKPLRIDINGIRLGNLIVVKREALYDIKEFLGYIHDSRGIDVSNFKERSYELWKRIKEEYNIE